MRHPRFKRWAGALAGVLVLGGAAVADEGAIEINWHTVDCGGDTSLGGDLEMSGTIGQPDSGVVMAGGSFEFTGGFWALSTGGTSCLGDLDGSGAVDFGDILAILGNWGNAGGPEDLDGSGTVDFGDLLVVLGNWGACT